MTEKPTFTLGNNLPHHKLVAYRVAVQLLVAVRDARIEDSVLRAQAGRAARGVCLNIAEAAGRSGAADRRRVFAIARGELTEVAAAMEIGAVLGAVEVAKANRALALVDRLVGLLTGLIRP